MWWLQGINFAYFSRLSGFTSQRDKGNRVERLPRSSDRLATLLWSWASVEERIGYRDILEASGDDILATVLDAQVTTKSGDDTGAVEDCRLAG
jgi:hypothetical protein